MHSGCTRRSLRFESTSGWAMNTVAVSFENLHAFNLKEFRDIGILSSGLVRHSALLTVAAIHQHKQYETFHPMHGTFLTSFIDFTYRRKAQTQTNTYLVYWA